MGFIT